MWFCRSAQAPWLLQLWWLMNNGVEGNSSVDRRLPGGVTTVTGVYILRCFVRWLYVNEREAAPVKKSPQKDEQDSLAAHAPGAQTPPRWIPVFAHFAWLLSWRRSRGGQVLSGRSSNASRVTSERGVCASLCPRTAPRRSANRAAAAAWPARWASASRAACTPGDVAPGWLVSISPGRRNLCRLSWRVGGSVRTLLINESQPDRHLRSMNCQVSPLRAPHFSPLRRYFIKLKERITPCYKCTDLYLSPWVHLNPLNTKEDVLTRSF